VRERIGEQNPMLQARRRLLVDRSGIHGVCCRVDIYGTPIQRVRLQGVASTVSGTAHWGGMTARIGDSEPGR
jgi:hypothetical protein